MSGVFSPHGIFQGETGIFSGDGVFSRGGVFDAPAFVDPLSGIPFTILARTHLGDDVATDISPDDGDPNPTFGPWDQPTSGQQGVTRIENGTPTLEFDGVNDGYLSSFQSSLFDAAGSFAMAWKPTVPAVMYEAVVGGSSAGPAFTRESSSDDWGLLQLGTGNVDPIALDNGVWAAAVAKWTGTSVRLWIRQGGVTYEKSYSNAAPFTSAAGFLGLGITITNSPFSYLQSRVVAAGAYTDEWTDSQAATVLDAFYDLIPDDGMMAMAGSENEMSGSENQLAGGEFLS